MPGSIANIFHNAGLSNRVLVGVLRGETKPGLYRFEGQGSEGVYSVDDAHLLTPDGDLQDGGSHGRPRNPSGCVAITGPGGSVWVIGFTRVPRFDEDSDDAPAVGDVDDNAADGDKVISTAGGAKLLLKAGGAAVLEGGGLASVTLNPIENRLSLVSSNTSEAADGFVAGRGRVDPGSTSPETVHVDEFWDTLGPAYNRVRIKHGSVGGGVQRELTVAQVSDTPAAKLGRIRLRETYLDDGSWIGEGQKYQWGGVLANEPGVLGNQNTAVLKEIIDIIKNLKVGTAFGPSSVPLPDTITRLTQLASELDGGKILSNYIFLSKDPVDPGTAND